MINLEGKKILIVDDNATNLSVLVNQAKTWKMLPVAADSANRALDKLAKEPVDIVLADISMPEMDGFELARAIKEKFPSMPVIGMNYPSEDNLRIENGVMPILINKPVRRHILRDQLLAGIAQKGGNKQAALNDVSDDFSRQYPLRILVAEDNLVNQKIAIKILNKLGYQPVIANNGKEAMEILAQETYDIILMDVQMPEMNGLEATRMIRTCLEVQPVIIAMTANVMQGDRDECLQAGMDDYMSKPIDLSELLSQLEKWSMVLKERRKMSA
jgi:CheY-like chemotaxis protein